MDQKILREAVSAWATLCRAGGLEPMGRDSDLTTALKTALNASATTLEEALLASSTDELVRAFFDLVQPFAHMFRAILEFFQAAGVREGRGAWAILIDEVPLDLAHFQRFAESWNSLACDVEVPAIDWHGALAVFEAARDVQFTLPLEGGVPLPATGIEDVDCWLKGYAQGDYLPFPPSLHPARIAPELADAAAITMASVDIIRSTWAGRSVMLEKHRARRNPYHSVDEGDGFSLRTLAQHETDHRLAHSVGCLALASRNEIQRTAFAQVLARVYGRYPRRKIGIRGELPALERILSLPLWQRRHELYAVWIATEVVTALGDHRCQLHHEAGRITFAFRETLVATVHTTRPKIRLYAERRSPLETPLGPTRKGNVQPDYGLWRGYGSSEVCQLVIEVKHYKRASPSRFRDVLTDYARAHPQARVLLVCHGAADESLRRIGTEIQHRCQVIAELTPAHLDQRARFRKLVRDCVGDPDPSSQGVVREFDADMMVAIDYPALRCAALGPEGLPEGPEQWRFEMYCLIKVYEQLEDILQIPLNPRRLQSIHPREDGSPLRTLVLELLQKHHRIHFVTNRAGVACLAGLTVEPIHSAQVGLSELQFLEVRS